MVLACRDEKKAMKTRNEIITESGNPKVVFRKLDLASLKSIRDFASEVNIGKFSLEVHVRYSLAGLVTCLLLNKNVCYSS